MKIWWVDSLEKVFRDANPLAEMGEGLAEAARNEVVSLQFVILSDRPRRGVTIDITAPENDKASLPPPRWRAVGYVPVKQNTPATPEEELVKKTPGLFPDPLLEMGSLELTPDRAQPIWLTLHIPPTAKPGEYRGSVVVADGLEKIELPYRVTVYSATLPEKRSLLVTNWFWADERISSLLGAGPEFSDSWWRMIESFLHSQWRHRQNVFWMPTYAWVCEYSAQGGQLKLDFSRFDRWCALLSSLGDNFCFEGPFITLRDGYDSIFEIPVPIVVDERVEIRRLPCSDPRVEPFLCQFLREYSRHLEARGLCGRVFLHIGDEPHGHQMPDYNLLAGYIKKYAPELPIMEALDVAGNTYESFEAIDIWVLQLSRFDQQLDMIEERRSSGKSSWLYTCLYPTGRYPNRFIDYSLLKTRLLHWINYRWNFPGYLHWGWNLWTSKPLSELEPEWYDGHTLPPGDAYLVYPGRDGVLDSLRSEQMLEGIQDYELLKLLEEKKPEMAQAIAAEAMSTFTDYVRDPAVFRRLRSRLLKALSE